MKTYKKLVRDKIPDIILKEGSLPTTRILDDKEYIKAEQVTIDLLIKKLKREALLKIEFS